MSDETKNAATAPAPKTDDLGNLKAEINRKFSNLEATNAKLTQQLEAILKPAQPKTEKKMEDVWFDQPEEAANRIVEAAEKRVMDRIETQTKAAARTNATIGALMQDFPELNDSNHELTKKAVEIYSSFSDDEKASPVSYRAAVREAAQELGVKPASKRRQDIEEESFSIGGSGAPAPKASAGKGKLDPATAEFARAMGLDLSKPEVKERLVKRSQRNFGRYE